jgi:hypothetical protein
MNQPEPSQQALLSKLESLISALQVAIGVEQLEVLGRSITRIDHKQVATILPACERLLEQLQALPTHENELDLLVGSYDPDSKKLLEIYSSRLGTIS